MTRDDVSNAANEIAYRWARAAFNLAHYADCYDAGAERLREAVRTFWVSLDYTGDEDEIIRVAILCAAREIAALPKAPEGVTG